MRHWHFVRQIRRFPDEISLHRGPTHIGPFVKYCPSWPKYHSQSRHNLLRKAHSIPERGVQMKKLLLGTVALAALGVPAIAADMGVRPVARPVVAYAN